MNASLVFGTSPGSFSLSSLIASLSSSSSSRSLSATSGDASSSVSSIDSNLWQLQVTRVWDTGAAIQWSATSSSSSTQRGQQVWELEFAIGRFSDDFLPLDRVVIGSSRSTAPVTSSQSFVSYTLSSLSPESTYRVRVIPVSAATGRGIPSTPLAITTLPCPRNYWEQIFPRRFSQAYVGRGSAYPVTRRPYLDVDPLTGMMYSFTTISTGNNSANNINDDLNSDIRATLSTTSTDTPTAESGPIFPAGRRGHSLTAVTSSSADATATTSVTSVVYMFGGWSDGDSCSLGLRDTTNLGAEQQSGIPIDPCIQHAGEVSECLSE